MLQLIGSVSRSSVEFYRHSGDKVRQCVVWTYVRSNELTVDIDWRASLHLVGRMEETWASVNGAIISFHLHDQWSCRVALTVVGWCVNATARERRGGGGGDGRKEKERLNDTDASGALVCDIMLLVSASCECAQKKRRILFNCELINALL